MKFERVSGPKVLVTECPMKVAAQGFLSIPTERAWSVLAAWEGQIRWMRDAGAVRVVSSEHEGVGVRLAVKTRVLGVSLFTEQLEVTLWDPPRRLVMAHRSFVRGVGEWILDPVAEGTWFRWTEELSLPVPVLGELALRAYRPFMRRLMRGAVSDLQAFIRSEAT